MIFEELKEIAFLKSKIYTKNYKLNQNKTPLAKVLYLHGIAEHINKYEHVFSKFVDSGIEVVGFDQPGFGFSCTEQTRGVTTNITESFMIIDEYLKCMALEHKNIPIILMGYSMGGLLAIKYCAEGKNRDLVKGLVALSPCIKIQSSSAPNIFKTYLIKVISRWFPNLVINLEMDDHLISSLEKEVELYGRDKSLTRKVNLERAWFLMSEGEKFMTSKQYTKINTKEILFVHGGLDKITCPIETEILYRQIKSENKSSNIEFYYVEDGYHELHRDKCSELVIDKYIDWILTISKSLQ